MKNSSILTNDKLQAGDAAVKGLFNGFIAGIGMAVVLVAAGLVSSVPATSTLAQFTPTLNSSLVTGVLAHLAVSGIYGLVFGLLCSTVHRWIRVDSGLWQAILAGTAYGFLLWLGAQYILLPTTGAALGSLPAGQFLLAHLAYGLILGGLFGHNKS
jgi:uncharacterized membrane protein YagU involved in acid resistance